MSFTRRMFLTILPTAVVGGIDRVPERPSEGRASAPTKGMKRTPDGCVYGDWLIQRASPRSGWRARVIGFPGGSVYFGPRLRAHKLPDIRWMIDHWGKPFTTWPEGASRSMGYGKKWTKAAPR
ncbi:MAG: hypothetical protein GKS06_02440 [Acidobacteria bacterium]|nr:hypothetical protein [Acidobacteriota bacterium]